MANTTNNLEAKLQRDSIKAPRPLHPSTMETNPTNYSDKIKSIIQGNQKTNAKIPFTGLNSKYNPSFSNSNSSLRRPRSAMTTYKSTSVTMHSEYDVIVCNIENGPKLFSVQLKSSLDQLRNMMLDLENVPLEPLSLINIGTACLARYSGDNCLYRALITNIHSSNCSVAYIDYGHSEKVSYDNLFVIPQQFLENNTFSIKFSLTGCKNLDLTPQVKSKFRDLVLLREVQLKVTPLDGPPLYQYCELYLNGQNILHILQEGFTQQILYREPDALINNERVIIRFINSPRDFYVQKLSTLDSFEKMMDILNGFCKNCHKPLSIYKKGMPCGLLYDEHYYRGEILDFSHGDTIQVLHVDFGYINMIEKKNICAIPPELAKLPRQAIHCCLKGFEDDESVIRESVVTQFEMLSAKIDGQRSEFMVTIFRQYQNGSYLVNLRSDEGYDLMKKLYKLSQPFNKYIELEKKEQQLQINSTMTSNETNETLDNDGNNRSRGHGHNHQQNGQGRIVREPINANARVAFENRNVSMESDKSQPVNSTIKDRQPTPFARNVNNNNNVVDNNNQFKKGSVQERLYYTRDSNYNKFGDYNQSAVPAKRPQPEMNGHQSEPTMPRIQQNIKESVPEQYLSFDTEFSVKSVPLNSKKSVAICRWMSPYQFYAYARNENHPIEAMYKKLKEFYSNKPPCPKFLKEGSNVIAYNRTEKTYFRAKIIATNAHLHKYKVVSVDHGFVITITDQEVWEVEKRFAELPKLSSLCSLQGVISNVEHTEASKTLRFMLNLENDVTCEYLKYDDKLDMYFVNLMSNRKSVIDEMVGKGLWSKIGQNVDFNFLDLQQIRATILSVNSMSNFKIKIEGLDVPLMASYNDFKFVKANPNKTAEFKEYYENKSFVLNVDKVTVDKIILLKPLSNLFHPDDNKYICRYPLIHNEFNVRVVHVEDYNKIFVHILEEERKIDNLNDLMFEYYEEKGNAIATVKEQQLCAAKSSDGNWYRAKVTKIYATTDKVQVFYFDYGNYEDVEKSKLKHIETKFCLFSSALAIELLLPIGNKPDDEKSVILSEIRSLTDNFVLKAKILECYKNRFISDLYTENYSVLEVLKGKNLIKEPNLQQTYIQINNEPFDFYEFIETVDLTADEEEICPPAPTPNQPAIVQKPKIALEPVSVVQQPVEITNVEVEMKEPSITVPKEPVPNPHENKTAAFLSHCDNPGKFFLQLEKDMNELDQLQENLQIIAGSLPPLMRVVKGANCICNYSVDHQWYRAKIIDSELLIVQFTDFGNTDALTEQDIKDIKEPVKTEREPFCLEYSLPIIPSNTIDWSDEANKIFNDSFDKPCYFEIIAKGEKKTFINLFIENTNIADYLISYGYAKPMETIPSGVVCFVSHINGLSDFYVQLENDSQGLDLMETFLAGYEKFTEISDENFKEGMICAALFPEDGNWYRAKTMCKTGDGYKVFYIDYGNTAVTNQIRELTLDIAKLPFLAKKCSLRLPADYKSWSEEAETKFSEIAALGETVFVVELKEPGEHVTVDLLVDGKNILEDLEPFCEKGGPASSEDILNASVCTSLQASINEPDFTLPIEAIISHVNAPFEFFIQFTSTLPKLSYINECVNQSTDKNIEIPILGTVCGVFYENSNWFYRGLISNHIDGDQYKVIIIDYGYEIVTRKSNLRALPDDIQNFEPLAVKCSLENDKFFRENPESSSKFKDIVGNYERVVIKIVDKDTKPWIIKVFGNEENLCEKLNKVLGNKVEDSIQETEKDVFYVISHLVSSSELYLQKESQVNMCDDIILKLNKNIESFENFTNPKIGDICGAYSDRDSTLYRAKIMEDLGNGTYNVNFIDYGDNAVSGNLKKLPTSISELPICCLKCRIPGVEDESRLLKFMDIHFGEKFEVKFLEENEDCCQVDLIINGLSLREELQKPVESSVSEAESNLVSSFKKCRVIYAVSPNDFYVVFNDDVNTLENIKKILLASESFPKLENPKVGDICIAKFLDDGAYYRAEITSLTDTGCEVVFIDFGNSTETNDVRAIPENEELRNVNNRAKHCALENLTEIDFWSEEAIQVFSKIINSTNFNETFQVEILQTNTDPWIVRLYFDDQNIAKELISRMMNPELNGDESDVIVNEIVQGIVEMNTEDSLLLHSKDIVNEIIHCSSGLGSMDITPTS